ncbi:hypothetical protein [Nodularia sp. LEGE 04288]|uniref:hypothetical protein n=1 Tax=Nodularia sp. LEGE 04288 TaxID=1828639 RepID=UPI001D11EEA9|nr:hypothetical protein [Nodularia sp. LEGE 04288]MCC2692814.1 hypothetical protein [Nodularia sp. LEGE 04288]
MASHDVTPTILASISRSHRTSSDSPRASSSKQERLTFVSCSGEGLDTTSSTRYWHDRTQAPENSSGAIALLNQRSTPSSRRQSYNYHPPPQAYPKCYILLTKNTRFRALVNPKYKSRQSPHIHLSPTRTST